MDFQKDLANIIANHNGALTLTVIAVLIIVLVTVCWYYSTGQDLAS